MKHEFKVGELVKVAVFTPGARRQVRVQGVVVSFPLGRSGPRRPGRSALVLHPSGRHREYLLRDLVLVARGV